MTLSRSARLAALLLIVASVRASASPLEYLSPRDPLAAELRVLELYDLPADSGRFRLPHFNTWPLARVELMGRGAPIGAGERPRTIVADRVERDLQRDAVRAFAEARALRSTPRAFERQWADDERVEVSVGFEGAATYDEAGTPHTRDWRDGTGLHVRTGVQVDRWLAYAHLAAAQLRGASQYTDVLLSGSDLAAQTEESYLSYRDAGRWDLAMGRQRFAWGPGEEGSLLLSRSAAPLTALQLHMRLARWRADLFALHATTHPGRGEQLAVHRIEWQPARGVRVGVSEAARYRSSGFQGVYLASVIPFALAQRLLAQDGDTAGVQRNNILMSFDASWRPADGTRVYGEFLIDDAHARSAAFPNKYGWQVGLDGAWTHGFTRLTWNTEYTWLSRYVYTSYYAREFTAQGAPLGFFTGPDSRRLHARLTWDPRVAWQFGVTAARTWKGENDLDEPFVPGGPVPPVNTLEGTPEVTDDVTGLVRWWPASGVDVSFAAGVRRRRDAGHVAGVDDRALHAALAFRLTR